jgi:Secretion system C-terminal sorting domain/Cohesin domain
MKKISWIFALSLVTCASLWSQQPNCLNIYLQHIPSGSLDTVKIGVKARSFQEILALQYALSWNPSLLHLVAVTPERLPDLDVKKNFNTNVDQGLLRFSWSQANVASPLTLPDESSLYVLKFLVKNTAANLLALKFVEDGLLPPEVAYINTEGTYPPALVGLYLKNGSADGDLQIEQVCTNSSRDEVIQGSANISIKGGLQPFRINWKKGPQVFEGSSLIGLTPGIYQVMVVDAKQDSVPLLVGIPAPPAIIAKSFKVTTGIQCDSVGASTGSLTIRSDIGQAPYIFEINKQKIEHPYYLYTFRAHTDSVYNFKVSDVRGFTGQLNDISIKSCLTPKNELNFTFGEAILDEKAQAVLVPVYMNSFDNIRFFTIEIPCDPEKLIFADIQRNPIQGNEVKFRVVPSFGGYFGRFGWSFPSWDSHYPDVRTPLAYLKFFRLGDEEIRITPNISADKEFPKPVEKLTITSNQIVLPSLYSKGYPTIISKTEPATEGEEICVVIAAKTVNRLRAMQFALRWDTSALRYLYANLLPGNQSNIKTIGNDNAQNGQLRYLGIYDRATTFDEEELFELCFYVKSLPDSTQLILDSVILAPEGMNQERISLKISDGLQTIKARPSVWPGDTDQNGIVDHFDLLPIGIAFNKTGTPRDNPTTNWKPQVADTWRMLLPNTNQDLMHVDADGSGKIEAQDTLPIVQNWGRKKSEILFQPSEGELRSADRPTLFVAADTLTANSEQMLPIHLGDASNKVEGAYGLVFSMTYDPTKLDASRVYPAFQESWLGKINQDLLVLWRNYPKASRIDVAMTRIDGKNIAGFGKVLALKLNLAKANLTENTNLALRFSNVKLINKDNQPIPIAVKPNEQVAIKPVVTGIYNPSLESKIKIFPQPSKGKITVQTDQFAVQLAELIDQRGQVISVVQQPKQELSWDSLSPGVYFLRIYSGGDTATKKIVIIP